MKTNRARDWFKQAQDDLCWAEDTFKAGHFAQTCFITQQVGEKALKAVALYRGYTQIKSHSILEIARALEVNGEIERIAKRLDQYYISTRYPDAFPAGAPFEYYTEEQASEALAFARRLLELTGRMIDL
ncbi:MAG: HEPN domain-containing protein [Spirochaetales bacterium]